MTDDIQAMQRRVVAFLLERTAYHEEMADQCRELIVLLGLVPGGGVTSKDDGAAKECSNLK